MGQINNAATVNRLERDRKILALRTQGVPYDEIAEQCGCAQSTACEAVKRWVAKRNAECKELAEELIEIELRAIDKLAAERYTRALGGNDRALQAWESLSKRRLALRGVKETELGSDTSQSVTEVKVTLVAPPTTEAHVTSRDGGEGAGEV